MWGAVPSLLLALSIDSFDDVVRIVESTIIFFCTDTVGARFFKYSFDSMGDLWNSMGGLWLD